MFDVNTIPMSERVHITKNLLRWGINVDQVTGKIDYIEGTTIPEVKCESIHLIRHAETVAVAKHEFMSDTSDNCGFTDIGIEITHQQAKELDAYDFDVALYGPIPRVVHTMELIMQTPQKFEAFKVHKLHGIDNTGWEYKSFEELQYNPTFIAREMENNMFARTPSGTSMALPGVLALFLFNITMPITLFALAQTMSGCKGFSFGLLTFALFLGYLPSYLGAASLRGWGMALVAALSALLLLPGLKHLREDLP